MIESRFYIKKLTSAEVGKTNTKETYIRLSNDFDYETFFQHSDFINGTVKEVNFSVVDLSTNNKIKNPIPMRFVYYYNSNHEKRIPSLQNLFDHHNVKANDVVCLESRTEDSKTSYYITFIESDKAVLSEPSLYYTTIYDIPAPESSDLKELFHQYLLAPNRFKTIDTAKNYWNVISSNRPEIQFLNEVIEQQFGIKCNDIFAIDKFVDAETLWTIVKPDPRNQDFQSSICSAILGKYKDFLFEIESKKGIDEPILPLQLIYFGAPGTSKSTTIKKQTENKGKEVHRITFHPDTDYSNFVGCYKPTNTEEVGAVSKSVLIEKLKQFKNDGSASPCHRFGALYWRSVKSLSKSDLSDILKATTTPESMSVEVAKGVNVGEYFADKFSSKITYKFVAQTFTKAYVSAWKQLEAKKEVFLVIEEINRGNCAQIFGDLFQLLDRNEKGYSEYKIEPDHDLQDYLAKELKDYNIPEDIKSGKAMLLPPNLYIWATMNTSDQSLFPIDSAFKRRWDWKYLPIVEPEEKKAEDKKILVGIKVGSKEYTADWWTFLEKINARIESLTESEDKQLGYWFAKAKTGRIIDMDTFVGKVVFYLWNDIFKDFGEDDRSPFMVYQENDAEHKLAKEKITFRKFFDAKGDVHGEIVKRFIESLEMEMAENTTVGEDSGKQEESKEEKPVEQPIEPELFTPQMTDETPLPGVIEPLPEPKEADGNLF